MKEKTADIDILEDLLSTQKQYIEDKDYQKEHNIKEQAIDYAKMWTKATETLIAENKEMKEKNKELTDKLKDCDLHYSKLYKFHNNNCVTKDRINQIINELIKLYFEEDSCCFSGFMFNNKTFNSLNIKEEMTVMQLLKHLQRLLKQEEE